MTPGKAVPYLASLAAVFARARAGDAIDVEGLTGPAKAAAVADLYAAHKLPLLVVCAEEDQARALARDVAFFLGRADDDADFIGQRQVVTLLPSETSPYDGGKLLPDPTRRMEMVSTLYALSQPFRPPIAITSLWGLLRRYIPKSALLAHSDYLLSGVDVSREEVLRHLAEGGYTSAPLVEDPGSFAVRGGIVDVFSPLYRQPLRLDFFGDTLESIRLFDPASQKSLAKLEEAYLIPTREIVLSKEVRTRGRDRLYSLAIDAGAMDRRRQAMLIDLEQGLYSTALEPYLPLFYDELAPLFAYLSSATRLVLDGPALLEELSQREWLRLAEACAERQEAGEPVVPVEAAFVHPDELRRRLERQKPIRFHGLRIAGGDGETKAGAPTPPETTARFAWDDHEALRQELHQRRGRAEVLDPLVERLRSWTGEGWRVFLTAHTETQLRRLQDLLEPHGLRTSLWSEPFPVIWEKLHGLSIPEVRLVPGALARGQIWPVERMVFIAEEEIFGQRQDRRPRRVAFDKEAFLSSLEEIQEGDFLVHVEFGVGVYRGLVSMSAGGAAGDFLLIEYLGNDKLYLPVTQLEKIQRYASGEGAIPRLDRLGGSRWASLKARVKAAIWEMAEELLKLYAARQVYEGFAFSSPDAYFREFEAAFAFEETPDQERAIKETIADMQRRRPMDRLVCGDVGFGKTEVAMRAAMKAVLDKKQVAVLVPTTVLALQHEQTFKERFAGYPVSVEMVSRFKTPEQIKAALERAKSHRLDILIGTHRLLSKDVQFADLGLLVVDEEHRFGVTHKEKIKQLASTVDCLTLTATPIPRTLNMAFSGVRDISIIQTPPTDRLAIRTFVSKFDEDAIREAIAAELSRGGQVYVVHNRVQSIGAMASLVKRLVPQARVAVGHGQMGEHQLEEVMVDFVQQKTNVLVCTTIIESGIDIPAVNTMIVNRADTFGLAQLYQLRGRVGRGKSRAYCYLLVPSPTNLTRDAQRRLAALMRFTELGSGFRIASHDMEIRGAGNLLGKQQSGHIAAIGLDLYLQLIEEVVQELKGERKAAEVEPQINLYLPAFLPDDYVPDQAQRLQLYKRLSGVRQEEELFALLEEIEDRFGRPPREVRNLAQAIELKILLRRLNAAGLDLAPGRVSFSLGEHCTLPPEAPIRLAMEPGGVWKFTPDMKLIRRLRDHELENPIAAAKNHLHKLIEYGSNAQL
ncbi:MAG: transcription-repair coupling factor [Myxococcales bacterium]|nr:MAG: transcription-repair coupling factor [Myxococcales bacterium]